PGRVDREDHDLAPPLRRAQAECRGRGGLADPARAAADHDPGAGVLEQGVDVERPGGGEVLPDRVGRLRVRATGRRLRTTAHDIPCFRYVRLTTGTGTGVGTGSGSGTGTGAGAGSGAATAGSVRRVPRAEEAGPGPPPPGIPAQVVPAYPTAALMTRPARADSGPVGTGRPGPCPPRT